MDGLNYLQGKELDFVNEKAYKGSATAHLEGGVPSLTLTLKERSAYSLGQLFYFLERVVAMTGYLSNVNPFDQPGVELYKKNMFNFISNSKITIIEDEVVDIITKNNKAIGVKSIKNKDIYSKSTILTTGTFLNGKIYFGDEVIEAGRINNKSSKKLALFVKNNFDIMRLKK